MNSSDRRAIGTAAGSAVLAILMAYLVFIGGGWPGIHLAPLRVLTLVIVGCVVCAWITLMVVEPAWRPRSSLGAAFTVALGVLLMTTLASDRPRAGVEYVAWATILIALYLLLQRILAHPFGRSRIGAWAAVMCAAVCVLYLGQVIGLWIEWWDLVGRIERPPLRPAYASLTFGNPSAVMTMALLLYVAAVAGLGMGTMVRRVTILVLGLLVGAVIITSGSRAGWLAIAISATLTAALWLALGGHHWIRKLATRRRARVALIGVIVVVGAAGYLVLPGLTTRLGAGGEELRLDFFASAFRMFATSPALGVGPGGWASQRILYTAASERDFHVPHAHNLYLQTAAETGLVGIAAGVIAVGSVSWLIAGSLRSGYPTRRWAWVAVFGGLYFAAHHLLDSYVNVPAALFAFAVPVALLDAGRSAPEGSQTVRRGKGLQPIGTGLMVTAVAVAIGVLAWAESTALTYSSGVAHANAGRWPEALGTAEAVAAADAGIPAHDLLVGLAAYREGRLADAAGAFLRVAESDGLPTAWLARAQILVEQGQPSEVVADLDRAMVHGYWDQSVALRVGEIRLGIGDLAGAIDAYGAALAASPGLADDRYWQDPPRAALRGEIIARAVEWLDGRPNSSRSAHVIAVLGQQPDLATQVSSTLPPSERETARLAAAAWAGDSEADGQLSAAVAADPLDQYAVSWALRLARHEGRLDDARRLQRMLHIASGSGGAGVDRQVFVEGANSQWDPAMVPVQVSTYYGHYSYRRPTPADQLLPVGGRVVAVLDPPG